MGPGSYQAHVVDAIKTVQRGAAGYTLFSADLLTFRKLTSQLARYEKDPKQIPGAFFTHPFLSVFNQIKKEMLVAVLEANLQGKSWVTVLPEFRSRYPHLNAAWDENRPYYKYTLANTYRTDIYGNSEESLVRWGFEIRGAHKNLEALLTEVRVIETLMRRGFADFERFLALQVVDTLRFEQSFTPEIRLLLKNVIPEVEPDDPKSNYFMFILRPFEQYSDLMNLDPSTGRYLRLSILRARTTALERLQMISERFEKGEIDTAKAREELMVALAIFCQETGLLPLLEHYQQERVQGFEERRFQKTG